MKKFYVCCLMALCVILSGCARTQPEPPEQPDVPVDSRLPASPPEPDPAPEPEPADPYVGTWSDPDTPQCLMEITGGDGYTIEIRWSRDNQETDVWQLTGTYDELWQGLAYTGAKYTENADGQRTPVPDREEITGLIYFEDGGGLCWIDDFDHAGAELVFETD